MSDESLYTPEICAVLDEFRVLKESAGWSNATAGQKVGASASTIGRLLNHEYTAGTLGGWIEKIDAYCEREAKRRKVPAQVYAHTDVAEKVEEALALAGVEQTIALILGASGVGKTTAVRHWCKAHPEAVYVPAGTDVRTGGLLKRIAAELRIAATGTAYMMRLAVTDALRGSERLLVIDECDYLGEPVLQCLRQIHEEAQIGLVLIGTEAYLQRLRNRQSSTINQVLGRISYKVEIPRAETPDIHQIARAYGAGADASRMLAERSGGSARRCVQAIRASRRFNGQTLSLAGIDEAFRHLMPLE